MAYLEDPRKRAAEEKKVRIDHSDVYLENEKLAEALNSNLDRLARRRHRQVINRDNEIRLLRKTLSSMNVTKTPTAASLQPSTTTTTTSFRRLKPPPTFVKLDVHVPHQTHGQDSDKDDIDDNSSDEETKRKWWKITPSKRTRVAWDETNSKEREDAGDKHSTSTKPEVKKITREELILNNLDLNSVPTSWFTQVHQPSDVILRRRRASSAHPSNRPTLPTSSSTTTIPNPNLPQRPQSETIRPRPRRTKSAIMSVDAITTSSSPVQEEDAHNNDVGALFCGGPQQQKKAESTRSRRQLMEEMGVGKVAAEPAGDALDSNRVKFLMALRRERERLDQRVKMFLQSCDKVGEGGISSRKAREFQTLLLPQTLT